MISYKTAKLAIKLYEQFHCNAERPRWDDCIEQAQDIIATEIAINAVKDKALPRLKPTKQ